MITLALDTSTDVRVGVARDGAVLARGHVADPRAHVEQLMPLVRRTLDEAGVNQREIDQIVVGVGPGPFTGLRVGVVTATTLGVALGKPVRGVCSLDAIAAAWPDAPARVAIVSDARRREVYWAVYAGGVRVEGPFVTAPTEVPELPLGGPGAPLVRPDVAGPTELDGGALALAGASLPDAGLEPLYLRRPDAELPSAPKSTIPQARLAGPRRRP